MKPMFLQEVETYEPEGARGTTFAKMREVGVPIPQIMHLFAFKQRWTDHLSRFTQEVMRGPSCLSPGQRELIAALTSKLNACPF